MNDITIYEYDDEDGASPLRCPASLKFEVEYDFTPAEPMVRYYRDGSGYPGSPAYVELTGFNCTVIDTNIGIIEPTEEQRRAINKWFADYVESQPKVQESIEQQISIELDRRSSYEGDFDDIDD